MEINSQLTREDYVEFNKYIFLKMKMKRSIFIALLFIIFWIVYLNLNQPFNLLVLLIELIAFALFWAVLIFAFYRLSFARIKKMPDENGEILSKKTYFLTDDGLKEISANNESFTKWSGFKSIAENKKYVFLFVDKIAAYIIPKRVFKDSEEVTQFLEYVKTRTIKR
jgi:hypothetical protein